MELILTIASAFVCYDRFGKLIGILGWTLGYLVYQLLK